MVTTATVLDQHLSSARTIIRHNLRKLGLRLQILFQNLVKQLQHILQNSMPYLQHRLQNFKIHHGAIFCLLVYYAALLQPVATGNESEGLLLATGDESEGLSSTSKQLKYLTNHACPSLQTTERPKAEHFPIVLRTKKQQRNLVVCRTPKVGSLEIRGTFQAYENDREYKLIKNAPHKGTITADLNLSEFQDMMFGEGAVRIMFVRHPVRRILSGYVHTALTGGKEGERTLWAFRDKPQIRPKNMTEPEAFHKWVRHRQILKTYEPTCTSKSIQRSMGSDSQHWAPPQHCRCGIHDCQVPWQIYKVEEHSIRDVLLPYIDSKYLPPLGKRQHSKSYNVTEYLPPDVLEILNNITAEERGYFGYEPLTL